MLDTLTTITLAAPVAIGIVLYIAGARLLGLAARVQARGPVATRESVAVSHPASPEPRRAVERDDAPAADVA